MSETVHSRGQRVVRGLADVPVLGQVASALYRGGPLVAKGARSFIGLSRWLATSRETTNFTYDLDPTNEAYLAAFVAVVANRPVEEIEGYLREIQSDTALRQHVRDTTLANADARAFSDSEARYGRRIGWYALVRALKPRVVVETGVEKGLGSVVLCAALLRNRGEGNDGQYIGTDIDPGAGWLLKGGYAATGRIAYGDSITSLESLGLAVDLFINDSDHSDEYEAREYAVIESALTPGAVVVGDNAHVTDKLFRFARQTGRDFLFFHEQPYKHWYPGGGIGVAFRRS